MKNFFCNGQPMIHQGNQIHRFGRPGFEIGTTWIFFFNFEHCYCITFEFILEIVFGKCHDPGRIMTQKKEDNIIVEDKN